MKNSFVFYTDYYEQLKLLNDEQRGVLLSALVLHQMGQETPEMDDVTEMAFSFIANINDDEWSQLAKKKGRATGEYRRWKLSVLDRDHNSCRYCGSTDNLHVHHILPYCDYPEFRTDIDNGITLCSICHRKVHRGDIEL